MSDPYNQYPPQQPNYGSPAPGPHGYGAPPPPNYASPSPAAGSGYPPQDPGYGQQQGYPPPAPNYADGQNQGNYGYGPPAQGGFQHAQQSGLVPYDQQQGQPQQSYGQQQGGYPTDTRQYGTSTDPSSQFPQQGAYNQNPYPADPNAPPQEGERGLGGAILGGLAGGIAGKQKHHGLLGTIGGAVLGSFAQDKLKEHGHKPKPHGSHHGSHHGSSHGGSSWGGKW